MLDGFRSRQQHGVAEMRAAGGMREDARKQDALVDLEALLVALQQLALDNDLLDARNQPRQKLRRRVDETLGAHESAHLLSNRAIERLHMSGKEPVAAGTENVVQCLRTLPCRLGALRLVRQPRQQLLAHAPEAHMRERVVGVVTADLRLSGKPIDDLGRWEPRSFESCPSSHYAVHYSSLLTVIARSEATRRSRVAR